MMLRALPCPATESRAVRAARLATSIVAAFASALIAGVSVLNLLGLRHDAHAAASLVFTLASLSLVGACLTGIRQPHRGSVFALAAATALALAFTEVGRGISSLTCTLSGITCYAAITNMLVLLLGIVFLCTQVAAFLARRHDCNCG